MTKIQLCNSTDCTGCATCKNVCGQSAISMLPDLKGFLHPIINDERCIACGACVNACPILNENNFRIPSSQTARKGWAKNDDIVSKSSSGGVFSLVAEQILSKKGHVYGACFDTSTWKLHHVCVDNYDHIDQLRGSKYVQSDIGETFKDAKKDILSGIDVLFVGTPCQIAGLHSFLHHKEYPNLITIDLVCHGVPSPDVFIAFTEFLNESEGSELVNYSFREKKWCWTRFNSLAIFKNGSVKRGKWEEDPYMRGFLRELFLRDSCHHCRFANMNRQGDITLADYWAYKHKHGEENNRERGCSLILMNNDKARNVIHQSLSLMTSYPITIEEAMMGNQALKKCFPKNPISVSFWDDFRGKGFKGVVEKYLYPEPIPLHYRLIYNFGKDSVITRIHTLSKDFLRVVKMIMKRILKIFHVL